MDLTWKDRMNTLSMRAARGTAKYASKKDDTLDKPEDRLNEDDNIEGHGLLAKDKELIQNEDEASEEEHEIQESELEAKRRVNVTVKVVKNAQEKYMGYWIVTQSGGDISVETPKGATIGSGFDNRNEAKDWIDSYIEKNK